MNLVTHKMVSDALAYLAENTVSSAQAKAARVLAEHKREIVKANLILQSPETNAQLREAWAKAHDEYQAACAAEADAIEADEFHRAARVKAQAIIQAWQTESANIRGAEKVI